MPALRFRVGPEGTIGYYEVRPASRALYWWDDRKPLGIGMMLSYWFPGANLSVDLEVALETFLVSYSVLGTSAGAGVVIRPGLRFGIPGTPLYLRGAIPINTGNVMMGHVKHITHEDAERFDLRTGLGVVWPLDVLRPFFEADMDFPLGGGPGPSAFSAWGFSISAGIEVRFPF